MKTHGKAVLGCVLVACLSSTAMAAPVDWAKDLEGKTVCWSTPSVHLSSEVTYGPGRKYYSTYSDLLISGLRVEGLGPSK